MTNKLFDSFVNNKLNDYKSPVPEGLWEKIVEEDERKPIAIWWWRKNLLLLGLGFLVLVAGGGYLITSKENTKTTSNKKDVAETAQPNNHKKVNTAISDNSSISINTNTTQINKKNDTKNSDFSNQASVTPITQKVSIEKNLRRDIEENKQNLVTKSNSYQPTISKASFGNSGRNNNFQKKTSLVNTKNNSLWKVNNKSNINDITNSIDKISNEDFLFSSKRYNNENTVINDKDLAVGVTKSNLEKMSIGKLFIDECPTTRGIFRNDFYIEGYISPDIAFKTVTSTQSGNGAYISKKDSSESMRVGFTVGARFSKSITNNLLFKAGLQYSQFNEKFTLRTENDRRQTIVINSHTITRTNQPDTTISDTTIFVQIGYRVRTNINRYKNLELPLLVSYELSQPQSDWKLAISGGAIVNLTSWYEGKTIDANYNLVNVSSKSGNGIFKNQVGLSLYASVNLMRRITNDIDVFAEPYYRLGLSNSLQSNAGFSQKFHAMGIQFGARLKISHNKHL